MEFGDFCLVWYVLSFVFPFFFLSLWFCLLIRREKRCKYTRSAYYSAKWTGTRAKKRKTRVSVGDFDFSTTMMKSHVIVLGRSVTGWRCVFFLSFFLSFMRSMMNRWRWFSRWRCRTAIYKFSACRMFNQSSTPPHTHTPTQTFYSI